MRTLDGCFRNEVKLSLTSSSNVDVRARIWICPFCLMRNPLPPHYKDITESTIPPELHPMSTTIEYQLARPAPAPPIFVYVVDTCQDEDSLKAVKDSLIMSLSLLPANALVGLITFGTMVGTTLDSVTVEWNVNSRYRLKYMSLATPNVPSLMCSVAAKSMLQSRSRRCLVLHLECGRTCPSSPPALLWDLRHDSFSPFSRRNSRSRMCSSSYSAILGLLRMTSVLSDVLVLRLALPLVCSRPLSKTRVDAS